MSSKAPDFSSESAPASSSSLSHPSQTEETIILCDVDNVLLFGKETIN